VTQSPLAWSFDQASGGKLLLPTASGIQRWLLPINPQLPLAQDTDADGVPDMLEAARGRSPLWRDNIEALTDPATIVQLAFREVLNRDADAGARSFYGDALRVGRVVRPEIYGQLFSSEEFEIRMLPIARLYAATFVRAPDLGGLRFWHARYSAGDSLDQIAELFAYSPETVARYGQLSNRGYVARLYENILARAGDVAGINFWTAQLDAGVLARGQLLARFSESREYVAGTRAKHLVDLAYTLLLQRAPTPADVRSWEQQLSAGLTPAAMASAFAGSVEYAHRFVEECASVSADEAPAICPR
jgi:hypothetical protein